MEPDVLEAHFALTGGSGDMFCTILSFRLFLTITKVDFLLAGYVHSALLESCLSLMNAQTFWPINIMNGRICDLLTTPQTESIPQADFFDGGGPTGALSTLDFLYRQRSAD